jgi:DNA-binding transcriptional LysR family regulator
MLNGSARSFDPVQLGSIELFCRAAELGGFSAAATALGLTPAAVSRSVARLESRLRTRLFARTTRSVRLTDDGRLYYEQCTQALAQIREAERAIGGRQQAPAGPLRISAPTTYAHHRLLPLLPRFVQRHPAVAIDLSITNRNVDFVEEGFDAAIRLGPPEDSRLVARHLEDASLGLFASPTYLKRHGMPRSLSDLDRHACIPFVLPSTGRPMPWLLRDGQAVIERTVRAALGVRDDVLGCVGYARAGGGITQSYHFVVADALARGELVEVLPQHGGCTRPFSILYPHHRHLSPRVRAFSEFLVSELARPRKPRR